MCQRDSSVIMSNFFFFDKKNGMLTFSFSTKNIDVKVKLFYLPTSRDDNGVGWGGVEGWGLRSCPA